MKKYEHRQYVEWNKYDVLVRYNSNGRTEHFTVGARSRKDATQKVIADNPKAQFKVINVVTKL